MQCDLPVNMFNEKIFLALSFWLSYMILHNLLSFLRLIYQQFQSQRLAYTRRLTMLIDGREDTYVKRFTRDYLTFDGIFLLRLISHNSSKFQAMEVLKILLRNNQGFRCQNIFSNRKSTSIE